MSKPRTAWICLCSAWLLGCLALDAGESGSSHQHVGALRAALRPLPGMATEPPTFDPGDRIEHYDSRDGFFRIHFTRSGRHAVPLEDQDGDGTPDYVNRVANDFDNVLSFYTGLGYRQPLRDNDVPGDHGGDDRFDVYLLDFPNVGADGQFRADSSCTAQTCSGFMLLENDFAGKGYASQELAIRLVSSHELFHAVQQAYAHDISGWLSEGTAVWASEAFDAQAGDLEQQVVPYLERPESSLAQDPSGTDPIRYGGALFFEFIDEHAGRDMLRLMWEQLADTGDAWPIALDAALRGESSSIAEQYGTFVEWNLFTAERADPKRAYAHGDMLPAIKERAVELGYRADAVRVFPLAAHYYTLHADRAQSLTAAAVLDDGTTADMNADMRADDLELMLAVQHAGHITDIEHAPRRAKRQLQVKLRAGDTAHVVLYNTRDTGGSVRPNLCIGGSDALKTCESPANSTADVQPEESAGSGSMGSGGCTVQAGVREPQRANVSLCLLGLTLLASHARRWRRATRPKHGSINPSYPATDRHETVVGAPTRATRRLSP